jgi:predicted RNase H-like HicB family nuclease
VVYGPFIPLFHNFHIIINTKHVLSNFYNQGVTKMRLMKLVKNYTLPVLIHREEDEYVAECPVFHVASQGYSSDDALENIKDALQLYLEDEDVQKQLPSKITLMDPLDLSLKARELLLEYGEEDLPSYTYTQVNICVRTSN